jgi:hypothetical protein
MALAPLELDDVTWEDLVLTARDNIAPASRGHWTLHSPVDPGVTLTELFAWLFEQRIYWLDQVDVSFQRMLVKLLGGVPRGAQAARSVFCAEPRPGAPIEPRTITAHGALVHRQGAETLTFTVERESSFTPIASVGLTAGGRDRTRDLERGLAVALFSGAETPGPAAPRSCPGCAESPAPAAFDAFELSFFADKPWAPGAPFGMLLELDTPAALAPGWAHDAVEVAAPAELEFSYRNSSGWAPLAGLEDGTAGLRRSGIVRFTPPADWVRDVVPGNPYALRCRVFGGRHTAPPRLRRVVPNVLVAAHRAEVEIGARRVEWLPLPGRGTALELDAPPFPESVELELLQRGVWTSWRATADLLFHGPDERRFVVDRARGTIQFGDGLTGRLPRVDLDAGDNFRGRAEVGGGARGNVARGNHWLSTLHPELGFTSVVDARGGAEPETLHAALRRRERELGARERAVTPADYEALARETPGIALRRAHAAVGVHPEHPCVFVPSAVTVFVVPAAPRAGSDWDDAPSAWADSAFVAAPVVDRGALAALRARFEAARLVTSEVFVANAGYRRVDVRISLRGDPADGAELARRVRERIRTFLDPLVGGAGDGWPFGGALRPSALMREAQGAAGVEAEVLEVALGLDGASPAEACAETTIRPHELVVAGRVEVSLERVARRGGLK